MNHYDILGVPHDASPGDIKRAVRRKSQRAHPDKPGGSDKAFHAVQRAADVLLDPDRRARYDSTGEDEAPKRPAAEDLLMQAFSELIGEEGFSGDYVFEIKRRTKRLIATITDDIGKMRRAAVRLEKLLLRVVVNRGANNAFAMVTDQRLRALRGGIAGAEARLDELHGMLTFMDAQGYADTAPEPAPAQRWGVYEMATPIR